VGFDQSTAGRRQWKQKRKVGGKKTTQSDTRKSKGKGDGPMYPNVKVTPRYQFYSTDPTLLTPQTLLILRTLLNVKGEAEAEKAGNKSKGSGKNGKGGGSNPIKW
jgi:hypothetical protein